METILDTDSFFSPCCAATPIKDENGRYYNLIEDKLEDYWNSYGLRQVRKKMLAGEKVEACQWCYYQESIGEVSFRKDHNKEWLESKYGKDILDRVEKSRTNGYRVEKHPLHLDIRPGNLCNLKCRMCGPSSSSKIEQEQRQMLKNNMDTSFLDTDYLKRDTKFVNWRKNKEIWKTIYKWAPGLRKLDFLGGEPTLIKENWDLIDYLKEKGYSKHIKLYFSINCTQTPNKLIETFETFQFVQIMFSVDGYKKVNEYIRYPSEWKEIEKNIVKILKNQTKNTFFTCAIVVQVYNILDLTRLLKWVDNLHIHYGNVVPHLMICMNHVLHIDILPENVKKTALLKIEEYESSYKGEHTYLLKQLNTVKNILKSEEKTSIEEDLKRFYKYTDLLDKHRDNNFKETFPELNALLDEDGRWKT